MLTEEQKNIYSKDGYVILPSVIPQNNLLAMVNDLNQWIEESKSQKNRCQTFEILSNVDSNKLIISI